MLDLVILKMKRGTEIWTSVPRSPLLQPSTARGAGRLTGHCLRGSTPR